VPSVSPLHDFAERATALLVRMASDPDPALASAYDELLFEPLYRVIRQRGTSLAMQAAKRIGPDVTVPAVQPGDLDAIAIETTVSALERARSSAGRFVAERGDGASWALGAAGTAYIDVVRDFYGVRRKLQAVPVDPQSLTKVADTHRTAVSPEQVVETRAALEAALSRLTPEERYVVLARKQFGLSYAEIATYLFGQPDATRRVDNLWQSARRKLTAAERAWNAADE
jgi:DNA-directed RNA polymerase specialized sigma24 family protein